MSSIAGKIAVVHLVRWGNDEEWFTRFLKSYHRYRAGYEHDLIIVFKGFPEAEVSGVAIDVPYRGYFISDEGVDITAYNKTVQRFGAEYSEFFFSNSHSEILCDNWLKILASGIGQEIGMVGCTGSWETIDYYPPQIFPNYHLRTNAFLISTELWKKFSVSIKDRLGASNFEAGNHGLTASIRSAGHKVAVLGKDGKVWLPEHWHQSCTFRSGEQENLMVADNRTRDYQIGGPQWRKYLSWLAWGEAPLQKTYSFAI